ncbi:hypothetical protein BN8_03632 [Fibrisoma limi BUZ 3]|uniref:Uncharacterized protein n=2 Tax=Fibrisoma limi TaxID=663275 RepID=I2GKN4_9BACT|nr:hypothetical protein BN8_03632 [Fibrisoma limi BUZ 3]
MAEACEMPPGTFYNIINGERKPSYSTIEKVCLVESRISAEYLLRAEGDPLRSIGDESGDRKALRKVYEISGEQLAKHP